MKINTNRFLRLSQNDAINPHSAGIDFRRQNLTSADVRFWRLKSIYEVDPHTVRIKIKMVVYYNQGGLFNLFAIT